MLINIINKELSKPRKKSKRKSKPAFKPSALGSPCLRKIYYSYNRVEEDYEAEPGLKKYGHIGDNVHDRLAEYLRGAGVLIDYYNEKGKTPTVFGKPSKEFPLKLEDLELSAFIDAVMIIDGKLWLGEWKTISKRQFDGLTHPKPDHTVQGTMYLYGFNKALKDGAYSHIKELEGITKVEGIRYLYWCRDNCNIKEFHFTEADGIFKNTLMKMAAVKTALQEDLLPPKTPDWCKSCAWRDKCAKNFKV